MTNILANLIHTTAPNKHTRGPKTFRDGGTPNTDINLLHYALDNYSRTALRPHRRRTRPRDRLHRYRSSFEQRAHPYPPQTTAELLRKTIPLAVLSLRLFESRNPKLDRLDRAEQRLEY